MPDHPIVTVTDIKPLALERGWDYRTAQPATVQRQDVSHTIQEEILDYMENGKRYIQEYSDIHGEPFTNRAKQNARLYCVYEYDVPETFTCRIPCPEIVLNDGLAITPHHEILVQSLTQKTALQAKYLFTHSRLIKQTRHSAGTHVSLLCFAAQNYFHWLQDGLMRLSLFPLVDPSFKVIIPEIAPKFIRETLHLMQVSEDRVVVMDNRKLTVDELILACPEELSAKPNTVHLLEQRRRLLASVDVDPTTITPKRLLYISRAKSARPLRNEAEIMPILAHHGFEIVSCENMTVAEQIRLFAEAKVIAGPHGAGFTNMLFAPPGATIIEFFNRQMWVDCYHKLASLLGHIHWHITAENENRENWATRVDLRKVEKVINLALR
jgi:hypothetical protein